jgi:hypothetical protein
MKRTALKRKTPLLRVNHINDLATKPPRKRPKPTKYKKRERAFDYMGWVKLQRCIVPVMRELEEIAHYRDGGERDFVMPESKCGGAVEADHAQNAGMSHKGPDALCIPLCTQHHRERTDFSGAFAFFRKEDMRAFISIAIQYTQNRARQLGIEVPTC